MKNFVFSFLLLCFSLVAQDNIPELIKQLGADSYKVRKAAEKKLWELAPESIEALRTASTSSDPEVYTRARRILKKLDDGIYPGLPEGLQKELKVFWEAKDNRRETVLLSFYNSYGEKSLRTIHRLLIQSRQKRLKVSVSKLLRDDGFRTQLFNSESDKYLETFLRLQAEEGNPDDFIAFIYSKGRVEKEIAAIKKIREKDKTPANFQTLGYLLKAAGNDKELEELCIQTKRNDFLEDMYLRQGRFKELASEDFSHKASQKIGVEMKKVFYSGLAGDQERYIPLRDEFIEQHKGKDSKKVIQTLLLCGETEEALKLAKESNSEYYLNMILSRNDFKTAAAFVKEKQLPVLSLTYAEHLVKLGSAKSAKKYLKAKDVSSFKSYTLYRYLRAYAEAYGRDQMMQLAESMLTPDFKSSVYYIRNAMYGSDSSVASYLWKHLGDTTQKKHENFKKLKSNSLPKALVEEIVGAAEGERYYNERYKYQYLLKIAGWIKDEKREKEYQKTLQEMSVPVVEEFLKAYKEGKFAEISDRLQKMVNNKPLVPAPYYLYGKCLQKAGKKDFQKFLDRANLISLSNNSQRVEFAGQLDQIGEREDALKQREHIFSCGKIGDFYYQAESALLSEQLIKEQKDLKLAWNLSIHAVARRFEGTTYSSPSIIQSIYANIKRAEFEKMLSEKDNTAALKLAFKYLETRLNDYQFNSRVMKFLEENNLKKEADDYYGRIMVYYDSALKIDPNNATMLNDWAWTSVLCNRNIPECEKKSRRSLKLEPENCNLLDTLAEVLKRKGDLEGSLKAAEKALKFARDEEDVKLFKERLIKLKALMEKK